MANGDPRLVAAQFDFSAGINSDVIPIRTSDGIPNGLLDNQLAWGNNLTVRGGGISGRLGWLPQVQNPPWSGIFQGCAFYTPDYGESQLIVAVAGQIYRVRTDTDFSVENLSAAFGLSMSPTEPQYFFAQAEKWLVIQDGSLVTNPLFFSTNDDGSVASMTQSNGFLGVGNVNNQIPPAGPMDYYQQRLWYAFGRFYGAGDIVFGVHGGAVIDRASVLYVTENPVCQGGDNFATPISSGNIRWLKHAANLDTALGQTNLFIGTRRAIFACNAPITRADWIATTFDNMPLQTVALVGAGVYAERGATPINNDIFFCSTPNGDVRSIQTAVRYFNTPGQIPLSNNINRVLAFNDRELLHMTSSMYFDRRFLQTVLPFTTPVGTAFKGIAALDFNPQASLQQRLPPDWEGILEGLNFLQLVEANIGGRDRGFSMVWGESGDVELWELSTTEKFDRNAHGSARVQWSFETATFAFGNPRQLKELETLEIWLDRIAGTVEVAVNYRPDSFPCWLPWHTFKVCAAKDCTELIDNPCMDNGYPHEPFCQSFKSSLMLPKPLPTCIEASGLPSNIGFTFQVQVTFVGFARVRGLMLYALPRQRRPFEGIVC